MNDQAHITMIFGKRGSGKSTEARNRAQERNRVLFFDTLCDDYGHDGVVVESLAELESFWARVYKGRFRIVYRPTNPQAEFPRVCELVFAAGNMLFVAEEVDLFFRQGESCPEFKALIQRGRHKAVDMICCTTRPKGFGRLLTSQTHEFVLFSTREPDDLDYLKGRCGERVKEQVQRLDRFEKIVYDDYADNTAGLPDDSGPVGTGPQNGSAISQVS